MPRWDKNSAADVPMMPPPMITTLVDSGSVSAL
jgi:hypothetical protein